jgi:transcriptional regulator with XRE-family HTH domain
MVGCTHQSASLARRAVSGNVGRSAGCPPTPRSGRSRTNSRCTVDAVSCTTLDADTEELAAAVGARVRHERQSRGWTLDRLAEAAGVSRRMVVSVEQGAVNPSIGTLLRISDALAVGLPSLVEKPPRKPVTVTRDGEGCPLWTSPSGGRAVLVAGTEAPDVVELWDWTLGSHDRHSSEAHTPGTRELLHVRQGTITIEIADDSVTLATGDAISFAGDVPHAYSNPRSGTARFSLAVFQPAVGPAPRSESRDE